MFYLCNIFFCTVFLNIKTNVLLEKFIKNVRENVSGISKDNDLRRHHLTTLGCIAFLIILSRAAFGVDSRGGSA
jgi:hypothetical protein